MTLLKKVVQGIQHYGNGQKAVFDVCVKGWVKKVDDYEMFSSAITELKL